MGDSQTQEEVERQFTDKDKLGIDHSIAAHIRWRKTSKAWKRGRTSFDDRHLLNNRSGRVPKNWMGQVWTQMQGHRNWNVDTNGERPTVVERIMDKI